ncbi:cytochrome P450 [Flagelloscypha sp. PMI_526]|nr:cytochrome P450 [Flagelloscypha sp. PMI_526]
MEGINLVTISLVVVAVYSIRRYIIIYHTLTDIPTVGSSGFVSTYWGIFDHLKNANGLLEQGTPIPSSRFTRPSDGNYTLVVTARLADAKKASDDELSAQFGTNDVLQAEFTLGPEVAWDPLPCHHNFSWTSHSLQLQNHIPLTEDWIEVPAMEVLMKMVSRISNRMIVGLPLCHNQEFLDINVKYTTQVITSSVLLRMFPKFLRPFAAKVVCTTQGSYRRLRKIAEPMLQERLDNDEQFGKSYAGRPNDLISWLLEFAQGSQRSIRDLCVRILAANFGALHTTTVTLTHILFDLATNPQYIDPLRAEIEKITDEHGWSKASLQKMKKLDSLMKESSRMWGILAITSSRLVMKAFTFSNGQVIPPGYLINFTARAIHWDEANFEDPHEFKPFRFSNMRDKEGQEVFHSFVTLEPDFVPFGIPNRHACPGRFFAATEIKGILAHLITTYDFKFEDDKRPKNIQIAEAISPSPTAKLLFRKRRI